jgi:hypothetical protein
MSSYLPEGFKRIPRADDRYAVSEKGVVFNMKTGKMLKSQWNGTKEYTTIKDEHGKQFRFCYEDLDRMNYNPLTEHWVFHVEQARRIPDFPDYAVSHYGAIYRVAPRKSGIRAKEIHMIYSFIHQGRAHIYLRNKNTRKRVRVDKITEQVWGAESTYED